MSRLWELGCGRLVLPKPFMTFNLSLALRLAVQSLCHHGLVAIATIMGVALGMTVVSAILIVDTNTAHTRAQLTSETRRNPNARLPRADAGRQQAVSRLDIDRISFIRRAKRKPRSTSVIPTQKGRVQKAISANQLPSPRGAEDYQAMRLAVRLASLLAFTVGALIVFYTMRYSVSSRSRAFSLLLCLGEYRSNVGLSLLVEAVILGVAGAVVGLFLSWPTARTLLAMGISTTGQAPLSSFAIPWRELVMMGAISVTVTLLGVAGPMRSLYQMQVIDVLQPRSIANNATAPHRAARGFLWVLPPLLAATYLMVRPFLLSWLSVVHFFLVEGVVVISLAILTLWWASPLLHLTLRVFETLLKVLFPLEVLLTGRRMRLTSQRIVFAIVGVTLVFSLLTCLHNITRSLKHEIQRWASKALYPYTFYQQHTPAPKETSALQKRLRQQGIYFFRLSTKAPGAFPLRLIRADDVNPYREAQGRPRLRPGSLIVSKALAARFGLLPSDVVEIWSRGTAHRFDIIDIADDVGFVAENAPYVDLKSYALFSDGNPLFANNLETTLDRYAAIRPMDGQRRPRYGHRDQRTKLLPYYRFVKSGRSLGFWQKREIDRDFLIFDFVMLMTLILAGIGVANTLLIQVYARHREFSVLRTIGISRWQVVKLLLIEGMIIGLISAFLALCLGNALGMISVSFLDHFTLFEYRFIFSVKASLGLSLIAIGSCCCAAIYPAVAAIHISSAESLHYE